MGDILESFPLTGALGDEGSHVGRSDKVNDADGVPLPCSGGLVMLLFELSTRSPNQCFFRTEAKVLKETSTGADAEGTGELVGVVGHDRDLDSVQQSRWIGISQGEPVRYSIICVRRG